MFSTVLCFVGRYGLALGTAHSLMLKPGGSVWAAGLNKFGQLGIRSGGNSKSVFTLVVKQNVYHGATNKILCHARGTSVASVLNALVSGCVRAGWSTP